MIALDQRTRAASKAMTRVVLVSSTSSLASTPSRIVGILLLLVCFGVELKAQTYTYAVTV